MNLIKRLSRLRRRIRYRKRQIWVSPDGDHIDLSKVKAILAPKENVLNAGYNIAVDDIYYNFETKAQATVVWEGLLEVWTR